MNLNPKLQGALILLGVLDQFSQLISTPSQTFLQLKARLEDFKVGVEKKYKQMALKAHPDLGGSNEEMQSLNEAIGWIRKLTVQEAPQLKPMQFRVVRVYQGSASTTTSTSTTGFYSSVDPDIGWYRPR